MGGHPCTGDHWLHSWCEGVVSLTWAAVCEGFEAAWDGAGAGAWTGSEGSGRLGALRSMALLAVSEGGNSLRHLHHQP